MKDCFVVGKTNVGKTVFVLNFAEYIGLKAVDITFRQPDGFLGCKNYRIDQARKEFTGFGTHKTRCLMSITLPLPAGKGTKHLKLTDTCGLSEEIHTDEDVRRAMAQTLGALRYAGLILHMIDVSLAARKGGISDIDHQIAQYGQVKGGYAILANKMDLPSAKDGLNRIANTFPGLPLLPVSALYKHGFKEVKAFVYRNL